MSIFSNKKRGRIYRIKGLGCSLQGQPCADRYNVPIPTQTFMSEYRYVNDSNYEL